MYSKFSNQVNPLHYCPPLHEFRSGTLGGHQNIGGNELLGGGLHSAFLVVVWIGVLACIPCFIL